MRRKALSLPCLYLLSVIPIVTGYLLSGAWMILPALLGLGLLFLLARSRSSFLTASVLLVGAFTLAVVGVLMQLSLTLMLVGIAGALTSWDLTLFSRTVDKAANREDIHLLKERHLQSLAIAIGGGVLLSLAVFNLEFELPFVAALALCAVALGGVYFGVRVLMQDPT